MELSGGNANDGTPIDQQGCSTNLAQSWYLNPLGPNQLQIVSHLTHKCLEVANGSLADQALIQENDCKGPQAPNQIWSLASIAPSAQYDIPSGSYHLVSAQNDNECLDVPGGLATPGLQLQQYPCGGPTQTSQIFTLTPF